MLTACHVTSVSEGLELREREQFENPGRGATKYTGHKDVNIAAIIVTMYVV